MTRLLPVGVVIASLAGCIIYDEDVKYRSGEDEPGDAFVPDRPGDDDDFTADDDRNDGDDIVDFDDLYELQNCELVDLTDLNTGSEKVRVNLAGFLNDLLSVGVAGFRIDAAKHMPLPARALVFVSLAAGSSQMTICARGCPQKPDTLKACLWAVTCARAREMRRLPS